MSGAISSGRRRLARTLVACALLALTIGASTLAPEAGAASGDHPNVVVLMTDDQDLASYRPDVMPEVTNLFASGKATTFNDAIVSESLCCPSRATFLTGDYAHNHGITANNPGYPDLVDKKNVLPNWLRASGYKTALIGKFLHGWDDENIKNPAKAAPGWDDWELLERPPKYYDYRFGVNGKERKYGHRARNYVTRLLTRRAVKFVKRNDDRGKPFFLNMAYFAPHKGRDDPRGNCDIAAVPDPRDKGAFASEPLPEPPSFDEDDVSDKPAFIQRLHKISRTGGWSVGDLQRRYRCGLESLAGVDRSVGKIVERLRKSRELSDTTFVFTSDNGLITAGEHRIGPIKYIPYEEALRVPLAIRPAPSTVDVPPVAEADQLVSNVDLPATILDLAGATPCRSGGPCRTLDGRSLVPLMEGDASEWPGDRAIAIEGDVNASDPESGQLVCEFRGVQTETRSYVEYQRVVDPVTERCIPADDRELYDLEADPFQLDNLLAEGLPEPPEAGELAVRTDELRRCAGIEGRDPFPASGFYCE